jgi:zinc D-Ala-D-Ala carboxypeptidase
MKSIAALVLLSATITGGCSSEPVSEHSNTKQQEAKQQNNSPKTAAALAATVATRGDGMKEVTNMLDTLVVVNKQRNMGADYEPPDLVEPNIPFSIEKKDPKKLMRKEAAAALEQLFAQAKEEHIDLVGQSAYRSYATQQAVFKRLTKKYGGEQEANKVSSHPGQSEHQTGLAIDITSHRMGFTLEEKFGETPEGIWLKENAPKYGFIIRYPKGKEEITGYSYEPWHIRYVGKEAAQEIASKNSTLEEYLSQ